MRKTAWIAAIMAIICLIPAILFASIENPTFSPDFYLVEYEKQSTAERLGMSTADLLKVTLHMQDYLKNKNDELNIETTVNGERRFFFSDKEIFHMKDVKNLFRVGNIARIICQVLFAVLAAAAILLRRDGYKVLLKAAVIVPVAFLGIMGLLAFLVSLNFDRAFTIFHKIFFTNDMWILDPSRDLLVNIVPQEFFVDIAIRISVIFCLFMVAIPVTSAALLYIPKITDSKRKGRK